MKCTDIRDDLVAYLDGELDPRQATLIQEHLADCSECRSIGDQHRQVWQLLDHYPPVPAPAGFLDRILARVRLSRGPVRVPGLRMGGLWIAAAAVLLVVLIPFGLDVVRPHVSGGPDLSAEEMEAALDMDMLENIEVLHAMDVLGDVDDPALLKNVVDLGEEVY